ncbi:MAG: TetR/AcrR family transcriptional regulator [Dehalococcoidia bacterium]
MISQTDICPRKHDKPGRQRALIDAATAVFAEKGYDAATTREIADRAGCSEGLIHRYFNGKRGLLMTLLENKAQELAAELRSDLPVGESLAAEIEQILLWQVETMWQRRDFMRTSISRATIDPELGRSLGEAINQHRLGAIAERLELQRAAGRIASKADVQTAARVINGFSFAEGFMAQVVFAMPRDEVRDFCVRTAQLLARGLSAGPTIKQLKQPNNCLGNLA